MTQKKGEILTMRVLSTILVQPGFKCGGEYMEYLIEKYSRFCKEVETTQSSVCFYIYTDVPEYPELIKEIRGKLRISESLREEKISKTEEFYLQKAKNTRDKESKVGIDGLDNNERELFLIDNFLMEVNNGGFEQYFSNKSGEYWNETLNILEKLELVNIADLGKKAFKAYQSTVYDEEKLDMIDTFDNKFYKIKSYQKIYKKLLALFN